MSGGSQRLVKVVFELHPDQEGWPPLASEGLWAGPLGGNRYRIDNRPWFLTNLAADDVVIARRDGKGCCGRRNDSRGRVV